MCVHLYDVSLFFYVPAVGSLTSNVSCLCSSATFRLNKIYGKYERNNFNNRKTNFLSPQCFIYIYLYVSAHLLK